MSPKVEWPVPTVAIVATGGTIANTDAGRIGIDSLVASIQSTHPGAMKGGWPTVRTVEVLREGADKFTPTEWHMIASAVRTQADDPAVSGVVVTHGTFTAEETAYYLHLTVHTEKPIIVVCSQRKHGMIGNDGDRNLVDAIRVAIAAEARGRGAMLVLNEEIHSARDVVKTNQRPSGFSSGALGILGSVEEDQVTIYRSPVRRHTLGSPFDSPVDGLLPRVDIAATYAGADGTAIEAFLKAGACGIIVSGFAFSGKPHDLQIPALRRAVAMGVPVVLVNRGQRGRVPVSKDDGFVRGDNLTAQKARILLSLALIRTRDQAQLQQIFDTY